MSTPSNPSSSKIKDVYIEIDNYQFFHSSNSEDDTVTSRFIGRKKVLDRLKMLLIESNCSSGAYLVTGYRGMGKTTVVEKAIKESNELLKSKGKNKEFKPIEIGLSQENVKDADVLRLFAKQLYKKWSDLDEYKWYQKETKIIWYFGWVLFISILYIFMGMWAENWGNSMSYGEDDYFRQIGLPIGLSINVFSIIVIMSLYLMYKFIFYKKKKPTFSSIQEKLSQLNLRLNAKLQHENSLYLPDEVPQVGILKFFANRKSLEYDLANAKEIEKELINILDDIETYRNNNKNKQIPQFVFIVDELDKIEPNYFFHSTEQHLKSDKTKTNTIQGINKARERQEVIARLLANLKHFLNTAKAKFIFIGGREMYDAYLADSADRDSFYSSIFNDVLYVNSFFKDKLDTRSGVTKMTEAYLVSLIVPCYYRQLYKKIKKNECIIPIDENTNITMVFHYLIDYYTNKSQLAKNYYYEKGNINTLDKEKQYKIYKTLTLLQNFVIYLTFRSNGTPKKLVELTERFMIPLTENKKIADIEKAEILVEVNQDLKTRKKTHELPIDRIYMKFSYHRQYEIGLTSNLYRPYVIIHSRYLKSIGDRMLYSTAFVMDYLLKFHPHAFSWRNLEMIPEIILMNKDPQLRYFMEDVLKFLSGMYVRETVNAIFQYKFYNKHSNEIRLLSKISETASAALNFTLDESLQIKSHYYQKLLELQKQHENYKETFIHSVAFMQSNLGDLHYFDKEYDDAIIYYTDAVQILRKQVQDDASKMTKHQAVLYVRNKLKLGLCLEKISAYDSAYSIYRGLILNMSILLDKVTDGGKDEKTIISYTHEKKVEITKEVYENDRPNSETDEWDKPIRRMQLFIRPFVALLDVIEKQRLDGITYENLERNFQDFQKFIDEGHPDPHNILRNIKKNDAKKSDTTRKDSMRVCAMFSDYFNNVGSLLYYKNKNYPELYRILLNNKDADYSDFIKELGNETELFVPSVNASAYYMLAFKEFLVPYDKFINIDNHEVSKSSFLKSIYLLENKYINLTNTTSLYTIGNLYSKIGDAFLSSVSKKQILVKPIKDDILQLFKTDTENFKKEDQIKTIKGLLVDFEKRYFNTPSSITQYCDINFVLLIYKTSSLFYERAGRAYSAAFQQKKVLFILRDYLAFFGNDIDKNIINNWGTICENIAISIIKAHTSISEVANRPQILKYRDAFKTGDISYHEEETKYIYLNISTSPEIKEVIVLVEEIKLLMAKIKKDNIPLFKFKSIQYDLITSKFTRIIELRYKCDHNYASLQEYENNLDFWLLTSFVSDLKILCGTNKKVDFVIDLINDVLVDFASLQRKYSLIHNFSVMFYEGLENNSRCNPFFVTHKSLISEVDRIEFNINDLYSFLSLVNIDKKDLEDLKLLGKTEKAKHKLTEIISQKAYDKFMQMKKSDWLCLVSSQYNSPKYKRIKKYIDEDEHKIKTYKKNIDFAKAKDLITDSIYCLYEIIRTLNLYGVNYITNHSYLANAHFKLANWCQAYINFKILLPSEAENISEDVKKLLGSEDIFSLEPNYHNELAIQHYKKAIQMHIGGNAYKNAINDMSFLEDDFNDNLTHFCAATERFRINTGVIEKKIKDLEAKVQYSNLYDYNSYTLDED